MKKFIICLLLSTTLLTACASSKESNTVDINNKADQETDLNTKDTNEKDTNDNTNTTLTKQNYIDQLDKLKLDLEASSDKRYESPVTSDLIQAANDEYKLWDDKLNEIYSVLKDQLSKDKMDKLTQEEVAWIKIRDEKAEVAAKPNEGGSIAPLIKITSLIESTRDRCYELVDSYMK